MVTSVLYIHGLVVDSALWKNCFVGVWVHDFVVLRVKGEVEVGSEQQ